MTASPVITGITLITQCHAPASTHPTLGHVDRGLVVGISTCELGILFERPIMPDNVTSTDIVTPNLPIM